MDALIGRTFGGHTLIHPLAHGGVAEIYLACDERDTQICALIKVVREANEEQYLHFQREVQALYCTRGQQSCATNRDSASVENKHRRWSYKNKHASWANTSQWT